MRATRPIVLFLAVTFLAACALGDDVKVTKEELPQPVLKTVEQVAPEFKFLSAEKSVEKDGSIKYQVNMGKESRGLRIYITPEGKWQEMREGSPTLFADAPAPVRTTIETASGGQPDAILKITHPGDHPFYRFRTTRCITAGGTLNAEENLGRMTVVKKEEVPQPVQAVTAKLVPGSDWFAVKLTGDKAKYPDAYEIRAKAGKFLIVSADGTVLETWDLATKLADVPAAVATEIHRRSLGRDPHDVIKIMPAKGDAFYLFRIQNDIAADGSVLAHKEED